MRYLRDIEILQMNEDGSLTLPASLLNKIGFNMADPAPIRVVIENGQLSIPTITHTLSEISERVEQEMQEKDVSLESLIEGLEESRDEVFAQVYGDAIHTGT